MSAHPAFQVLLDRTRILQRTEELAREIAARWPDGDLLLVSVIEGARTFCRELQARLPFDPEVREIRASSYGNGTVSSGTVKVDGGDFDVAGRRLLIVEDIVDTGRTVQRLGDFFRERGAAEVEVVSLLSKPSRRVVEAPIAHLGFEIEDHFVIGFGMDVAGRYREIPEIVLYDEAVERAAAAGTAQA